ncbi:MAG: hypothetical protein QM820_52980 [Minicystis sp.]
MPAIENRERLAAARSRRAAAATVNRLVGGDDGDALARGPAREVVVPEEGARVAAGPVRGDHERPPACRHRPPRGHRQHEARVEQAAARGVVVAAARRNVDEARGAVCADGEVATVVGEEGRAIEIRLEVGRAVRALDGGVRRLAGGARQLVEPRGVEHARRLLARQPRDDVDQPRGDRVRRVRAEERDRGDLIARHAEAVDQIERAGVEAAGLLLARIGAGARPLHDLEIHRRPQLAAGPTKIAAHHRRVERRRPQHEAARRLHRQRVRRHVAQLAVVDAVLQRHEGAAIGAPRVDVDEEHGRGRRREPARIAGQARGGDRSREVEVDRGRQRIPVDVLLGRVDIGPEEHGVAARVRAEVRPTVGLASQLAGPGQIEEARRRRRARDGEAHRDGAGQRRARRVRRRRGRQRLTRGRARRDRKCSDRCEKERAHHRDQPATNAAGTAQRTTRSGLIFSVPSIAE